MSFRDAFSLEGFAEVPGAVLIPRRHGKPARIVAMGPTMFVGGQVLTEFVEASQWSSGRRLEGCHNIHFGVWL